MSADYGPIECGEKPKLVKHISIVPEWCMVQKMGDGRDQSGVEGEDADTHVKFKGVRRRTRRKKLSGWKCTPHMLPSPSVLFGDPWGGLFDQ